MFFSPTPTLISSIPQPKTHMQNNITDAYYGDCVVSLLHKQTEGDGKKSTAFLSYTDKTAYVKTKNTK